MGAQFVHDDRFVESFANRDHTVYGRKLDPFCLWHQFGLEVAQSKLLLGEPLTPIDLWVAVQICTSPWTPGFRVPDLTQPGKLRFIWQVGRYNFLREVAKFQTYFDDYSAGPKFWANNHEKGSTGAAPQRDFDETLETALHLKKHGNFTWPEVWTMPLGAARWCSVGLSKLDGAKVDIWTPEHEEMFKVHETKREAQIDAHGREIAAAKDIPYEAARKEAHDHYWAIANANLANANRSK